MSLGVSMSDDLIRVYWFCRHRRAWLDRSCEHFLCRRAHWFPRFRSPSRGASIVSAKGRGYSHPIQPLRHLEADVPPERDWQPHNAVYSDVVWKWRNASTPTRIAHRPGLVHMHHGTSLW